MTTAALTDQYAAQTARLAALTDQYAAQTARLAAERQLNEDIYVTFSSAPGQRTWAWIQAQAFHGRTTIAGQPNAALDALATFANEGKRVLMLQIWAKYELGKRGAVMQETAVTGSKDGQDG